MPLDRFAAQLEKMLAQKHDWKKIISTFMPTRDMYLHFTRSSVWANGNRYNFSSRVKTRQFPMLFNGRALIFTFSETQVGIAEIERLQSLFKMSMASAEAEQGLNHSIHNLKMSQGGRPQCRKPTQDEILECVVCAHDNEYCSNGDTARRLHGSNERKKRSRHSQAYRTSRPHIIVMHSALASIMTVNLQIYKHNE